jgi:hypothetical protein
MSDLVTKVAMAMCTDAGFDPFDAMANDGPRWRYYEPQARAAIKAVAEWMMTKEGDQFYAGKRLLAKLEAANEQ